MTHRARILGFLLVGLVVAGFVFNIVSNQMKSGTPAVRSRTPSRAADARQPMGTLYVPQPASVIYGSKLTSQSPADDVAVAFAISYFTYNTAEDDPAKFVAALPRLSKAAQPSIRSQVDKVWKQESSTTSLSSTVDEPGSTEGTVGAVTEDGTRVTVHLVQETHRKGQEPLAQDHEFTVALKRDTDGQSGWTVSKIEDRKVDSDGTAAG